MRKSAEKEKRRKNSVFNVLNSQYTSDLHTVNMIPSESEGNKIAHFKLTLMDGDLMGRS